MAQVIKSGDAKDLGLAGRVSKEIVSGTTGPYSITLRLVEIPPEIEQDSRREPHFHRDTEECIYVLSGKGLFCTDDKNEPLTAGDTVIVPKLEPQFTRKTGKDPLMLLCFFPVPELKSLG